MEKKAGGCEDSQSKKDKDNRYASCRDLSVRTRDVSLAVRLLLHHSKFKGAGQYQVKGVRNDGICVSH